jgi:hypothetical protein
MIKVHYKKLMLIVTTVFGLSACVGVAPGGQGYTINVPMHMINTNLGHSFPKSQQTNYGTLLIDRPNVLGQAGSDKLGVGTSFSFSNFLIPNGIKGVVSLSSGVRFDPRDKGLYLTSPMIDELKFKNFSLSEYITPQMKNMIGDLISQQLIKKPIYRMNNMGASFVRDVSVRNGNLVLTVGL